MKSNRANYVMVGSFVLTMVAGLVLLVLVLSAGSGATDTYYTIYTDVGGLKNGTQVLYQGFPVGNVQKIIPMRDALGARFKVKMGVMENWHIPDDSIARVSASGLLSAVVIDIREGQNKTYLKPGDTIEAGQMQNVFAAFSSVANDVGDLTRNGLKPLLDTINQYVSSFGSAVDQNVPAMLKDVRIIADEVARRGPAIIDNVDQVSRELRETSERVKSVATPENARAVTSILANFQETSANFAKVSRDLDATRTELHRAVQSIGAIVNDNKGGVDKSIRDLKYVLETLSRNVDSVSTNMEGTSRNMFEFSRQIRQNPGLLLGSKPPHDEVPR